MEKYFSQTCTFATWVCDDGGVAGPAVFGFGDGGGEGEDCWVVGGGGWVDAEEAALLRGGRLVMVGLVID